MEANFGVLLRKKRKARGMSQNELARKTGVDASYISKLEQGKEKPSPQVVRKLAGLLDADPGEFELAAGQVPEEFKKVIMEKEELRRLLMLAAEGRLTGEDWKRIGKISEQKEDGLVNVPVWLEE